MKNFLVCLVATCVAGSFISCQKQTGNLVPVQQDSLAISYDTIQTFLEKPSGSKEAKRLGQSNPASDFTSTGLYLPPNTDLTLYVEQEAAGTGVPRLLIGSYSRYEARWDPRSVNLTTGLQTIAGDAQGGLLFVRYHANDASVASGKVRIEFRQGHTPVPHFILGKTTNGQWQRMLDTWTGAPDVLLENGTNIIVSSRAKALTYRSEDQQELLTRVEEVSKAEYAISGIDQSTPQHARNVHKIIMTETDKQDTYMAATWYRTWYHTDVMNAVLTVDGFGSNGWGPWHELGHMHQQGAWTWDGLGEVTVNIYSLAAERKMGVPTSRLTRDGVWYDVMPYLAKPYAEKDFNGASTGLFVRLAMFQQLWLAFGDSFYQNLHKQTREEQVSFSTTAQKMRYFMLKACTISGKNLGAFFQKWGLKVDASVYAEIDALGLPEPADDLSTKTDDPDWENKWLVIGYSSQETAAENGRASNLIDGDVNTYWHSSWSSNPGAYPHFVSVDMKKSTAVHGFTLTQRNGQRKVKDVEIQISSDNTNWSSIGDYVLQDHANSQTITLPAVQSFRYFKLIFKTGFDGTPYAAMAEVAVF
ncbi:M60 family metallopeptidase [Sphingobacterium suaedae]|uniref:M60 family metallopeptidase n=1 Tax=Sphingobacterium suaedae TaxID=1686402 RepID=A0ABW5KFG6_9SPHI